MIHRLVARLAVFGALAALAALLPSAAQAGTTSLPPVLTVQFQPDHVTPGGVVQIRFDVGNPNGIALTGVAFTFTLPAGLSVPNIGNTAIGCGTVSATSPSTITYSNGTIAANTPSTSSPCNFEINVTSSTQGVYTGTSTPITSAQSPPGNSGTATLTVGNPPTISKTFSSPTAGVNGSATLSFALANPNSAVTVSGIGFTDTLPAGMVIAAVPNLSNSCGGTATATAGGGSVALSGGTLGNSATCTVSVAVAFTSTGIKNNTVQVSSTNLGNGNTSNTSISVLAAPSLSTSFNPTSIAVGASAQFVFSVANPNASNSLTGIAFTDTLPAGLVVATPNGASGTCGGGGFAATAGGSSIGFSGGTLAANSTCTVSVNVTGTSAGTRSTTTGAVASNEAGTGNTSTASITIDGPPTFAAAFSPTSILAGGNATLAFTIGNPAANPDALTGIGFSDTLPAGLTVASATSSACGGTLTTTSPSTIALTGATLASGATCQVSVSVSSNGAPGSYTVTTAAIASGNGGSGSTANATLQVASGSVPTLDRLGMLLLALLLVGVVPLVRRR